MDPKHRQNLDARLREYFISEIRKEFGDDFKLVEDRIDQLLMLGNLKETKVYVREELINIRLKNECSGVDINLPRGN